MTAAPAAAAAAAAAGGGGGGVGAGGGGGGLVVGGALGAFVVGGVGGGGGAVVVVVSGGIVVVVVSGGIVVVVSGGIVVVVVSGGAVVGGILVVVGAAVWAAASSPSPRTTESRPASKVKVVTADTVKIAAVDRAPQRPPWWRRNANFGWMGIRRFMTTRFDPGRGPVEIGAKPRLEGPAGPSPAYALRPASGTGKDRVRPGR